MQIPETVLDELKKVDIHGKNNLNKEHADILENLIQDIFEVFEGYNERNYISVIEKENTDVINSRGCLCVELNGEEYLINVRNGNNDGSVIESIDEDYIPVTKYKHEFILDEIAIANMSSRKFHENYFKIEQEKIQKKCGEYIYDRYFAPGTKTTQYYIKYMKKHCLTLKTTEIT